MEFQNTYRIVTVMAVVIVAGYSEFQMNYNLRIFSRYFILDSKRLHTIRLDNRTIFSQYQYLFHMESDFIHAGYLHESVLFVKGKIGARFFFFSIHRWIAKLFVVAKNNIFMGFGLLQQKERKKKTEEKNTKKRKKRSKSSPTKVYCMNAILIYVCTFTNKKNPRDHG